MVDDPKYIYSDVHRQFPKVHKNYLTNFQMFVLCHTKYFPLFMSFNSSEGMNRNVRSGRYPVIRELVLGVVYVG